MKSSKKWIQAFEKSKKQTFDEYVRVEKLKANHLKYSFDLEKSTKEFNEVVFNYRDAEANKDQPIIYDYPFINIYKDKKFLNKIGKIDEHGVTINNKLVCRTFFNSYSKAYQEKYFGRVTLIDHIKMKEENPSSFKSQKEDLFIGYGAHRFNNDCQEINMLPRFTVESITSPFYIYSKDINKEKGYIEITGSYGIAYLKLSEFKGDYGVPGDIAISSIYDIDKNYIFESQIKYLEKKYPHEFSKCLEAVKRKGLDVSKIRIFNSVFKDQYLPKPKIETLNNDLIYLQESFGPYSKRSVLRIFIENGKCTVK